MTDALQIGLQNGLPGCLLIAGALALIWRLCRVSLSAIWAFVRRVWGRPWWVLPMNVGLLAVLFWGLSSPLSAGLEQIETRWLNPVYVGEFKADSAGLIQVYENEIRRHTSPAEFEIVKRWTETTAERIGSTPIAIYEAAYLECGLNPFRVRDDRIAAGWIQFTNAGLSGLGVSKNQVIQACRERNAGFIMKLTDRYLARKAARMPEGASLANTIDLYLAIFAPAHIGKAPDAVVYAGVSNPAYFQNSGLDGWRLEGGKIVRGGKDGRITVREIWLCIERKKQILLKART